MYVLYPGAVGPPVQVVRPEIKEVNGSNMTMGCTCPLSDGNTTCGTRGNGAISYLIDGVSPDINTSNSDWASQLVTLRRRSGENTGIPYPHVLLTFGFDTSVSLTEIEMDWFLCPDWGTGAPSIIVYLNENYNLASPDVFTLPFVFADGNSTQSSCDSLSTVTISGDSFDGEYYRTFHIVVTLLEYPSIEWVYIGEVRFLDSSGIPLNFSGINAQNDSCMINTVNFIVPALASLV